ncbi:protein misato homolog 1-like [Dendronephthya gigantea]|nr:protein misato homolog 1-like [Dendronephthya gigantea]
MSEGFDHFGCGEMLFKSGKFYNEFEDRLHFFSEECDRLQGFQVFTDIHDGFAGLSSSILQDLADDYSKKFSLCFAMMPGILGDDGKQTVEKTMLNTMLSFGKYIESDCQVIPLSLRSSYGLRREPVEFPYINYKASSTYQTSAILASAIDTATLPFRLSNDQATDISTLIGPISVAGRKISALTMGLPIPLSSTGSVNDILNGPMDFNISLTPDTSRPESILAQTTVVRGIPTHLLKLEEYNLVSRRLSAMLQYKTNHGHICPSYVVQTPCKFTLQFPDIFKPSVTQIGCIIEDYNRPEEVKVSSTSAMASLVNCEEISRPLERLYKDTNKFDGMNYSGFLKAGTEQADIEDSREKLKVLAEAYKSDYEL